MPLGWYLAQGLVPLYPSSSDDEEGPCELPDGRVVCGPHGLVRCGRCCTDYSILFTDSDEEEDDDDDDDVGHSAASTADRSNNRHTVIVPPRVPSDPFESKLKRGTGRHFPTKFVPSPASGTPSDLFSGRRNHMLLTLVFIRQTFRSDGGKAIIYTDGACLNNGQANPKAGWAFWHGFNPSGEKLVASYRLEKKGPFGDVGAQTSNRAELRAVIAALSFRYWPGEGFHTVVFATDSEYVVKGATEWVKSWLKNDWKTSGGANVKNRDLWEALLGQVEKFDKDGMAVQFWRIPRNCNVVADAAAKDAAAEEDAPDEWTEVMGINV
ncbi:hypothetical protein CP532_3951 [Ophiocordyceps camponoti-leonardi (nom. inval.)]|nr:hypothetical protein CP532_3951 [Ophiocordyceps camponoti-leonardi (nom. inval.)]